MWCGVGGRRAAVLQSQGVQGPGCAACCQGGGAQPQPLPHPPHPTPPPNPALTARWCPACNNPTPAPTPPLSLTVMLSSAAMICCRSTCCRSCAAARASTSAATSSMYAPSRRTSARSRWNASCCSAAASRTVSCHNGEVAPVQGGGGQGGWGLQGGERQGGGAEGGCKVGRRPWSAMQHRAGNISPTTYAQPDPPCLGTCATLPAPSSR